MPTLSIEQLKRLTLNDITQGHSLLLHEPYRVMESFAGRSNEEKELELINNLPKKLGCYYLVFRLDALWANGGFQAVVLDKDIEFNALLLQATIEAFDFFGALATAALLREIVPTVVQAAREIEALVHRDASDDEFEPIWARLDSYGTRQKDAFAEVYPAILVDIHKRPADWQLQRPWLPQSPLVRRRTLYSAVTRFWADRRVRGLGY